MEIETTVESFSKELMDSAPKWVVTKCVRRPIEAQRGTKLRSGSDLIIVTLEFVKQSCGALEMNLLAAWLLKVIENPCTKNVTSGGRNIEPSEEIIRRRIQEELNIGHND
jgi:hypothetical protein